jgi:hypothetical protein
VVASDAFADAWVQANRVAHQELVAALTGKGGGAVTVENDTVKVNLAAFIQTVKARLVDAGFSVVARIPEVQASFVLFQSADIPRARSAFHLLDTLGVWLPIVALILLAIGVYVARDHRRALVGAALGVAVGMVVLALGLAIFRSIYLDAVPATVLPHDAAAVLYDTIVRFLRLGLRTILVLALVVAAGTFLSGSSVTAVRTRQGLAGAIGWLAGSAERAGLRTGPVGTAVEANKRIPAGRRRHRGRPGAGVLGPPHRQGRPRPHPGPAGRPGPDRIPRPTGARHGRVLVNGARLIRGSGPRG